MPVEVEIKAWVRKEEETRSRIERLCLFVKDYIKEDLYFRGPRINEVERDLRVRRENDRWICTYKNKTLRRGLEINDEREFSLSDGKAFMDLLEMLGCKIFLRKIKRGRGYSRGDLTVELSEVEGLGLFVEVERVVENPSPALIGEIETAIRSLLDEIGVPETDIEDRPYMVMLLGKGAPR
jgi:adenylate cyclase class 2